MHTLTIIGAVRGRPMEELDLRFPSGWHECSVAQLGTIAALTSVPTPPDAGLETAQRAEAHLRIALLRELSGMPAHILKDGALDVTDLLTVVQDDLGAERVALLPQLDWCLAPPSFSTSLVPSLTVRGQEFSGPTNRLGRFSLHQWGFADLILARLQQSGSSEDLHHLLGALYHEADKPWCSERIEARGDILASLDDRAKLAAVLNYQGLRAELPSRYKEAFRAGKASKHGMQGLVVRMAGPKFGTAQEAGRANIHDVLIHVEQTIADADELKSRTPN